MAWVFDTRRDSSTLSGGTNAARESKWKAWPTNSKIHSVDFGIGGRLPLLPRRKRQLEKASDFLSQTVRVYLTPRPGRLRQPKSHLPGRIRNVFYLQLRKVASMYSPRS